MVCAYCGREAKGTKEHIISCSILDMFPECYITFDDARKKAYEADPMIKDVCADCNNNKISYIDSYAKKLINQYFVQKYEENDSLEMEYDYVMVQKMLLKYAFNDMRSRKENCDYFDEELKSFLMDENDINPKDYISILCGLAVNVSPLPDAAYGNMKLRWCKNPMLFSNSTIRFIDYDTGEIVLNDKPEFQTFDNLEFSYAFRFNSVQFVLFCWKKDSDTLNQDNVVISVQYPYSLLTRDSNSIEIRCCTDEVNYPHFEMIHVSWDGLFEVGTMRRLASGGEYKFKTQQELEWKKVEEKIRKDHPR